MRKLTLTAIFVIAYAVAAMAGFSFSGTKFYNDTTFTRESGLDSLFVVKTLDDAYITYKATAPYKFKWEAVDLQGNVTELKTEEEAVDTTFVKLENESTMGYRLIFSEDSLQSVWVFDYEPYIPKMDTVIVNYDIEDICSSLQLQIYPKDEEPAPEMQYRGEDETVYTLPLFLYLAYDSVFYTDKAFEHDTITYRIPTAYTKLDQILDHYISNPVLGETKFTIYAGYALELEDKVKVGSEMFEPRAVESHVFASVRIREDALNENDKGDPTEPTEETEKALELKGSAPVNFEALNYSSPAAFHYVWYLSQNKEYSPYIMKSYDKDLRYTFKEQGTYYIKVEISNNSISEKAELGCTQTREFTVNVINSDLQVPNVFTPNGDGINDEFKVAYKSIIEFHGWVYSQWGRLVYEWTDPAQGWDGTINGKPAADGAYMYIIEATGDDYDTDGNRIKYLKRGAVSIVR